MKGDGASGAVPTFVGDKVSQQRIFTCIHAALVRMPNVQWNSEVVIANRAKTSGIHDVLKAVLHQNLIILLVILRGFIGVCIGQWV